MGWVRVARDGLRVSGEHLRNPPAPDLQREALLVSRDALRRNSLRTLRQSEPLCWIRRIGSAALTRSPRSGQGAAGAPALRLPFCSCAAQRAVSFCVSGWHWRVLRRGVPVL